MSRNQRIALLAGAVVVAVVAFVIAQSGGDDSNDNDNAGTQAPAASDNSSDVETKGATTFRLTLKDAEVVGGVQTLTASKGDTVRIVISSDAPDQVHLHGYDVEKEAEPGKPAVLRFRANVEGAFELESHTAEHEGKEPLIGRLHVEP